MMHQSKVVTKEEMARVEKLAIKNGSDELAFMENAASSAANHIEQFIKENSLSNVVTVLAGKGNNGGDGYVVATLLLEKGYAVKVVALVPIEECGKTCQDQRKRFISAGGKVLPQGEPLAGLVVDALVGTGFSGRAEGPLADAILQANHSGLPVIAIDIPSGLCGTTGEVETIGIKAKATIYLEMPKIGFFLEDGPNHTGKLLYGVFGLPKEELSKAVPSALVLRDEGMQEYLPLLPYARNKYSAGYVLALAGSGPMMGAGTLVSHAALKSGAGIVRWFYPEDGDLGSVNTWPEVIKQPLQDNLSPFFKEMERASSVVVGPGMGRDRHAFKRIKQALSHSTLPTVVDADALFFLYKNPSTELPMDSVLTPHTGEMHRLLEGRKEEGILKESQDYVEEKNVTLLLKGAPNFLFRPGDVPLILPFGNPGMATAGSGDVLAGVIAALLAQGLSSKHAALLGCFLHGLSGDLVAKDKTEFSLTASDLVLYLEKAFGFLLKS